MTRAALIIALRKFSILCVSFFAILFIPWLISVAAGQGVSPTRFPDSMFPTLALRFSKDVDVGNPSTGDLRKFTPSIVNARPYFDVGIGDEGILSASINFVGDDLYGLKIFVGNIGQQSVMHSGNGSHRSASVAYTEMEFSACPIKIAKSGPQISAFQTFNGELIAPDTKPTDNHQTISEINKGQIRALGVANEWVRRFRYFIVGCGIAAFGICLICFGERDCSQCRFINQVARAIGPAVVFLGILTSLFNIT